MTKCVQVLTFHLATACFKSVFLNGVPQFVPKESPSWVDAVLFLMLYLKLSNYILIPHYSKICKKQSIYSVYNLVSLYCIILNTIYKIILWKGPTVSEKLKNTVLNHYSLDVGSVSIIRWRVGGKLPVLLGPRFDALQGPKLRLAGRHLVTSRQGFLVCSPKADAHSSLWLK